jgi:hypothetical protein
MIFEYALEPELVSTWGNRSDFRYYITKFGIGTCRLVSRYPKRWKRLIWESFSSQNDMERKRLEEMIMRLSEKMIIRSEAIWNADLSWLENAEEENSRLPFHAIIARSNPRKSECILTSENIGSEQISLWSNPKGLVIKRNAKDMAVAVSSLLSNCSEVVFVDPHFGPENKRHVRPLVAFLRIMVNNQVRELVKRIEVYTSDKADITFFHKTCIDNLTKIIPKGLRVKFCRLKQQESGDKLHNRYILTDIGGVRFDIGLDEGIKGETDDVSLLDKTQYKFRWKQYASDKRGFDIVDFIEIQGRAEI